MSQQQWPYVKCRPVGGVFIRKSAFGNRAPMMDAVSATEAGAAGTPSSVAGELRLASRLPELTLQGIYGIIFP